MTEIDNVNIDDETIRQLGLRVSDTPAIVQIAAGARVFEYPFLDNVFVMESDLYGNRMPIDSCFLAFNGTHGLIGKHLRVETLRSSSVDEIKAIIESNIEG